MSKSLIIKCRDNYVITERGVDTFIVLQVQPAHLKVTLVVKVDEMMNDENEFDTLPYIYSSTFSCVFSLANIKKSIKCKITDTKQKNVPQKIYLLKTNSASDPLVHPCPPLSSQWHYYYKLCSCIPYFIFLSITFKTLSRVQQVSTIDFTWSASQKRPPAFQSQPLPVLSTHFPVVGPFSINGCNLLLM